MNTIFHLSFPVVDLEATRHFYGELLGCAQGRTEADRIDFEFFGHHIVAQQSREEAAHVCVGVGPERYPLRHFGAIVPRATFETIAARLTAAGVQWIIPPEARHVGTVREQQTMMALDPSGNAVEFKSLAEPQKVFKA